MPRPATAPEIVNQIEEWWGEDSPHPRATRVYEMARRQWGDDSPSLRVVQQVVRKAKAQAKLIPPDLPAVPWDKDWPVYPAEIECLFNLMLTCNSLELGPLNKRVAKWALRLRGYFDNSLDERHGIYPHLTWAMVYARRERVQEVLERNLPRTADLDGMFMYRALDSAESWDRYKKAVKDGLIPELDSSLDDEIMLDPSLPEKLVEVIYCIAKGFKIFEENDLVSEESLYGFEQAKQSFEKSVRSKLNDPRIRDAAERLLAEIAQGASDAPPNKTSL